MYGRVLSFLIRHFSNYYTLHRSDLAARAARLDPRLARKNEAKTEQKRIIMESVIQFKFTFIISPYRQRVQIWNWFMAY